MVIMMIPDGFKIRRKADVQIFINECMQKGNEYYIGVNNNLAYFLEKDKNGIINISEKRGDLSDMFNPLLEIASTDSPTRYRVNVEDAIWKLRKYINARYFK